MTVKAPPHPYEHLLRSDRLPDIWCPGCGVGTVASCLLDAVMNSGLDPERLCIVSGIGCSGRVAGYVKADSFHTTHGRAIPFATGLALVNRELNVVVVSGDGDLAGIGGNHLIHAARRNVDMTVICINNFNYGMTGGQTSPTTHDDAVTVTTPYGAVETPLNLPMLVAASGATYVARWTAADVMQLRRAIKEAMLKPGFSFIEVISPCPTNYGRKNKLGPAVDEMIGYRKNRVVKNSAPLEELALPLRGELIVGKFVDVSRPTLSERIADLGQE